MLVPVKIECGCGQKYAFDAEPINGQLSTTVGCPACGTDGTAAANQVIARALQTQAAAPVVRVAAPAAIRVAVPTNAAHSAAGPTAPALTAPRISVAAYSAPAAVAIAAAPAESAPAPRLPGQMDRDRVEAEARAKIMWGDEKLEVFKFLRTQGVPAEEANQLIEELLIERAEVVRQNGQRHTFQGAFMICVPIIAFFAFKKAGFFPLKIFGATVAVGCWGAWKVIKGVIMILSPKSEGGDVADQ